ncbi:hypothetical protein KC19_5G086400 [Ceratodon purpureus]|uniref:Uncharacterized protein n=1 Tax=Ceratodon purpureus TaxID=3225 RepID=A0A8T0I0W0_CERPU|nr:hypothetical protein KC19_5G086400 [Ceratodon purpureus]
MKLCGFLQEYLIDVKPLEGEAKKPWFRYVCPRGREETKRKRRDSLPGRGTLIILGNPNHALRDRKRNPHYPTHVCQARSTLQNGQLVTRVPCRNSPSKLPFTFILIYFYLFAGDRTPSSCTGPWRSAQDLHDMPWEKQIMSYMK